MPDPSPDTPSVCPTCGSDKRNVRNNMDPRRIHPDWCEDTWHDAPATPAAPGSSSPDTAALVAELRGPSGLASTSRAKHLTVGVCAVAADALEAQASRITELEAALAPFLRLVDPEEGGWRVLDDDVLEIDDSTPLTVREADAIRAQLARHP
jgi:hypothetical protein